MTSIQTIKDRTQILKLTAQFQLLNQLKHYGLNPKEWRFQELTWSDSKYSGLAEVSHRKDPNLRIKGRIEKSCPRPNSLYFWQWADLAWDL